MNEFLLVLLAVIVTGALVGGRADAEIGRWRFWAGAMSAERDDANRRRLAAECALTDLRALWEHCEADTPYARLGERAHLVDILEAACAGLIDGETVTALQLQACDEEEAGVITVAVTCGGTVRRSVHFPVGVEEVDGEDVEAWAFVNVDLPDADSPEWGPR